MVERDSSNSERRAVLKIPTPWGPVEVRGISTIMSLVLAAVVLIGYMLYDHDKDTVVRRSVAGTEHKQIIEQSKAVESAIIDLTYVFTLSPEERGKLKLDMPDSLRKRLRDR